MALKLENNIGSKFNLTHARNASEFNNNKDRIMVELKTRKINE